MLRLNAQATTKPLLSIQYNTIQYNTIQYTSKASHSFQKKKPTTTTTKNTCLTQVEEVHPVKRLKFSKTSC